jgi:hypothetical protein
LFYKAMTMTLTMWCAQLRKEIWRETSYNLHRSLRREYHPSLSVWSPRDLPSGHSEGTVKIPSHVNRSISEGTNRYSVTTCVTMPHHVTSALLTAPPWTHPSPQDFTEVNDISLKFNSLVHTIYSTCNQYIYIYIYIYVRILYPPTPAICRGSAPEKKWR